MAVRGVQATVRYFQDWVGTFCTWGYKKMRTCTHEIGDLKFSGGDLVFFLLSIFAPRVRSRTTLDLLAILSSPIINEPLRPLTTMCATGN